MIGPTYLPTCLVPGRLRGWMYGVPCMASTLLAYSTRLCVLALLAYFSLPSLTTHAADAGEG